MLWSTSEDFPFCNKLHNDVTGNEAPGFEPPSARPGRLSNMRKGCLIGGDPCGSLTSARRTVVFLLFEIVKPTRESVYVE